MQCRRFGLTAGVFRALVLGVPALIGTACPARADNALAARSRNAMLRASKFFAERVASHGGYVYHYSVDLSRRWGEGEATVDQIWVQPPGTPTVGLAFLTAYEATGERFYLDAARRAAEALVYGQLESGGWTNCIDFNPHGERVSRYRHGRGKGRNVSSLDDGQTQSAIRLLVRVDQALGFKHAGIHQAARAALDALLAAQFANGGFPQVWTGPVKTDAVQPAQSARYPDVDWRTEGRIKDYWDMLTLNDNVCGYVADALIDAYNVYRADVYKEAVRRLGRFLVLAQMPDPQPGWAQQYNDDMVPIWARAFEPPGIAADESQEVIETLMRIYDFSGDRALLEPIPNALNYLEKSMLPDGKLARFYELRTNRPLYMHRDGRRYVLTYDDSDLPDHYGWKIEPRLTGLRQEFGRRSAVASTDGSIPSARTVPAAEQEVRDIVASLDPRGCWVSTFSGERLVGQLKLPTGTPYIASAVFSRNLEILSAYVAAMRQ
jgi:hypothetical protein